MNYSRDHAAQDCCPPMPKPMPSQLGNKQEPAALVCLKRLYSVSERLDNISLNLRDKLHPISRTEVDCVEGAKCATEEVLPDYFTELRGAIYQLNRSADRLESIYERCEI